MTSITAVALAVAVTAGWSVDAQTDQRTVERLRKAAEAGRVEELGRGIADAPAEVLDAVAQSATCAGQLEPLRLLVEKGARPARFGPGGLLCLLSRQPPAAESPVVEIETYLIEKGMSLRGRFSDGVTLLHAAVRSCRPAWVAPLLRADADVNNATSWSGATPLMRAASCTEDVISPLLQHGADRRAKDRSGRTAITYLLDAKLDEPAFRARLAALVPARPLEDPGPLLDAARRGHAVAVEALLAEGASVTAVDKDGNTPLEISAWHRDGCPRCIEALLAKGAKVDVRNRAGATPLHLLARNCEGAGCEPSARVLIAAGADLAARDAQELTPLDVALGSLRASLYGQLLGRLEFRPLASLGASATASGTLVEKGRPADFYAPSEAIDGKTGTCWCVRDPKIDDATVYEPGPGWEPYRGAFIEVRLPKAMRLRAARVFPGCSENRSIYEANQRVAALRFDAGADWHETVLVDDMRFHDLPLETKAPVDRLKLWVLSVFPGKKFPDTCIAEIQLLPESDQ